MANTLGAPTEGLGQNITFAPPGAGQAPQLSLEGGQQALQSGVSGGPAGLGGTRGQGVQGEPYRSPVLDTLLSLAGDVAKARIQEAKTDAYVAGMQRASSGEAVAEIAADQPWYATMFGDTDVVEGARWYAGHTVAQETANSFDEDMQELRRLDPERARSEFTQRIQSRLTGDSKTDATILQSMTQVMPGIFKRHTKEHLGFLNEEAATAMSASTLAASQRLQMVAKHSAKDANSPGYGPKEQVQAYQQFLAANTKPPGMDEKTFREVKMRNLEHAAKQGNFHAIQVLEQAGFIDALPTEDQDKFRAMVEKQETRALLRFGEANVDDLARISIQAGAPPDRATTEMLGAMIQGFNEKFQKETGASRPYFSAERAAALLSGSAQEIIRLNEREFDKRLAAAEKAKLVRDEEGATFHRKAAVLTALRDGTLQQLLTNPKVKRAEVDDDLGQHYFSLPDVKSRASMLARMSDNAYEVGPIKQHLVARINTALKSADFTSGVLSDDMAGIFREYSALREISAPAALASYGEYGPRMDRWYRDVKEANMPAARGFLGFLQGDARRAKLDQKEFKSMLNEVRDELNPKMFGIYRPGPEMHPSSQRLLGNLIEDSVARSRGFDTPLKAAVASSLRAQRVNGHLNFAGGHFWLGSKDTTPLIQYLTSTEGPSKTRAIGTDDVQELVADAFDEAINGRDGKYGMLSSPASHVFVEQLPDSSGGIPNIVVHTSVNGDNRKALIRGEDIFKLADQKREKIKARQEQRAKQDPLLQVGTQPPKGKSPFGN